MAARGEAPSPGRALQVRERRRPPTGAPGPQVPGLHRPSPQHPTSLSPQRPASPSPFPNFWTPVSPPGLPSPKDPPLHPQLRTDGQMRGHLVPPRPRRVPAVAVAASPDPAAHADATPWRWPGLRPAALRTVQPGRRCQVLGACCSLRRAAGAGETGPPRALTPPRPRLSGWGFRWGFGGSTGRRRGCWCACAGLRFPSAQAQSCPGRRPGLPASPGPPWPRVRAAWAWAWRRAHAWPAGCSVTAASSRPAGPRTSASPAAATCTATAA